MIDPEMSTLMTASRPADGGAGSSGNDHTPPGDGPGATPPPGGERPGDQIGPYTLLERIGQGGFGVVWLAQRTTPFVQRVALKIIKPGMDSHAVITRFEQERQTLALMDHPNVARVLDGGVTSPALGSRPYFVMEHVQGEALDRYADARRLTIHERLALFISVCHAVQHAHHKGVIHRDLKPANVLVSQSGDTPTVKVIDFGIAKAITPAPGVEVTQAGWVVGTPIYMSPEQASGDGRDIDTRSDVYALGVLLYELLAGSPPVDPKRLESQSPLDMLRLIRETEPPRLRTRLMQPASRLSEKHEPAHAGSSLPWDSPSADEIATRRSTSVGELARLLSGELEWIPLKAMRKDRERRYQSANELAEDIERYLDGLPLRAGPESFAYTARKFVARHTGAVVGVAAVLLAVVAGVAATLIFAAKEYEQRVRAERSEQELKEVTQFQAAIISGIDPESAGAAIVERIASDGTDGLSEPERVAVIQSRRAALDAVDAPEVARRVIDQTMLAPAAAAIDERFKDSPAVAASLKQTLAESYVALGMLDRALPLQEQTLALRREHLGEKDRATIQSIGNMAHILMYIGELERGVGYAEEAVRLADRWLGSEDADTLAIISNLGNARQAQGRLSEAEALYQRAYEGSVRASGKDNPDALLYLNNIGGLQEAQGKLAEAERSYRESMEGFVRTAGPDSFDALIGMNNLGGVLESLGRMDEAEALYRRSLDGRTRTLGRGHPSTLIALSNMAYFYMQSDRNAEAEAILREGVAAATAGLGAENPTTLTLRHNLASAIDRSGRPDESLAMTREVLEARTRVLGPTNEATIATMRNLGRALITTQRFDEAERTLLEAARIASETLPPGNGTRRTVVESVVMLYEKWDEADPGKGHADRAMPWREALERAEAE
ncbi:MAG: serine/threonine protein kinase [Phycisphaeraceae bacterium]|nr:serine/threonine protein kinase [Phycisphaeraceae bacterium]